MIATLAKSLAPQWADLKNCLNAPVMREHRASYRGLELIVRGRAGGSVWRWKVTDGRFVKAKGTDTDISLARQRANYWADQIAILQERP
jgi:hypothetical protein